MILGLDSKYGVDGGDGQDEFHVIVTHVPSATDDGKTLASVLRATCTLKMSVENSVGFGDACERQSDDSACAATFSMFDIEGAFRLFGLSDVFDGFQKLASGSLGDIETRLLFIRQRCLYASADSFTREIVEASHREMCANVHACHESACVENQVFSHRDGVRCMVGEYKIGICDFMEHVNPTVEEVYSVALINKRLDANGCRDIGYETEIGKSMRGIETLLRWSSSWSEIEALGAPFGLMMNNAVTRSERAKGESHSVRLVFRLDSRRTNAASWVMNVGQNVVNGFNSDVSSVSTQTSAAWRHFKAYELLVDQRLAKDSLFAIGSLCVTVGLITITTRSVCLALGGIISIAGTFVLTHVTYFELYRCDWFGIIHIAGIFLAIGIGADDIYIIADHWRESSVAVGEKETRERTMQARMEWTMSHSLFSIGITSFTTSAAFASNIPSSIEPVRLFGIYMATEIILMLCVTVVVIGSVLAINEKWKDFSMSKIRVAPVCNALVRPVEMVAYQRHIARRATVDLGEFPMIERIIHRRGLSVPIDSMAIDARPLIQNNPWTSASASTAGSPTSSPTVVSSRISRRRALFARIIDRMMRSKWTLIAAYLASIVGAGMIARNVLKQSGDESLSMWPRGHVIHTFTQMDGTFNSSHYSDNAHVTFVFGLDAVLTSANAKLRGDDRSVYVGTPVLLTRNDSSYDFSEPRAQIWLLDFCASLKSDALTNHVHSPSTVNCWISDMDTWLRNGGMGDEHVHGLPIESGAFREALRSFSLVNKYGILKFLRTHDECDKYKRDDELCVAYSAVSMVTSIPKISTPEKMNKGYEFWANWFDAKIASGPPETVDAFQCSQAWMVADTVQEIKSATLRSIVLSIVLAFGVLFLCTRSFLCSSLATFCIASVIVYFVAFMSLKGWRFGIIEAVCVQIIVGISIDYPCHVCIAYIATRRRLMSRKERSVRALRTVGTAVASGWLSSVASAACLLGCVIVFFTKFASFIIVTLTSSFILAVIVLPVALAALGPSFRSSLG